MGQAQPFQPEIPGQKGDKDVLSFREAVPTVIDPGDGDMFDGQKGYVPATNIAESAEPVQVCYDSRQYGAQGDLIEQIIQSLLLGAAAGKQDGGFVGV